MTNVRVNLGSRSYSIHIGKGNLSALKNLGKILPASRHVGLTSKTVYKFYKKALPDIPWIVIPDGERYKNLAQMEKIFDELVRLKADRKTALVVAGGGVVGDMGGFAAATYLRGIPFIQVPTTLLAQVDSSVGGKTGVDLKSGKNLVGAFYQPRGVFIDTEVLKTLPRRELLCGLAEVIKYGVIWDEAFFRFLEKNVKKILALDQSAITKIIRRSCEIKAEVVSQDEREGGLRAILNYGHTLGHAVETLSGFSRIKHGEAVARGMVFAAHLSYELGLCNRVPHDRLVYLLECLGMTTSWPSYPLKDYAKAIAVDKKSVGDRIKFVGVTQIGKVRLVPLTVEEIVRHI